MLIFLFADYHRDAELRAQFSANPDKVLERYGLKGDPRAAALGGGGDPRQLEKALLEDVRHILENAEPLVAPYPGRVSPKPASITPTRGDANTGIKVTVEGTGFHTDAHLFFSRPNKEPIPATDVDVPDTETLTGTISCETPGLYGVEVKNPDGRKGSLPAAFTVEKS